MHPLQSTLSPDLESVWLGALVDAGISPERALLITRHGTTSPDGRNAVYMRKGLVCEPDGLDREVLDGLNSTMTGSIDAYRVVLWTDRQLESAAALIRHELEHARQIDARPEVDELHALAESVVRADPDNSGRLYQQIPAEADANAAAAVWVRSYFGADRVDRLIQGGDPDAAALRPSGPPTSPIDLPERMIAFFASIAPVCRQWAEHRNFLNFSSFLNLAWRGAGESWEAMTAAEGVG